ncbi:MAG: ABC transporter permease [Bacteroidales bacterium]|nr:ABC transporter permease [Bacteroidales bacterium]
MAKKSHNAINVISYISAGGVAVGTMALIVVLSVFNGFDTLVQSLFNSFKPDLVVTVKEGKTFIPDQNELKQLSGIEGVEDYAEVLEDNVLLRYDEKQTNAVLKGVSDNFIHVSGIDSMMRYGSFTLKSAHEPFAIVGQGIAYFLNINVDTKINYRPQVAVYVPRRTKKVTFDQERAINRKYITPNGIFSIEQDFDSKYVLVPLEFARELFAYDKEISSLEIKLAEKASVGEVQKRVSALFGDGFEVKNRYQQNELFFKTMQTEKWMIFLILVFILAIASFNVIGSLTMLVLEKKADIGILRSMGADMPLIKKIFFTEGWLIIMLGALIGIVTGLLVCWLQIKFEIIGLPNSGSFVIDSYPVVVQWKDVAVILASVLAVGYFAAWYPVRYVTRRFVAAGDAAVY